MFGKVKLYSIKSIEEINGNLSFLELPFAAKRTFFVYGVRVGDVRGNHAHRVCKQFLVCLSGMVSVTCDDGHTRKMYTLDSPRVGLYVPPMIWAEQFYHSRDTVLAGFASHKFDEADYIREYERYKRMTI